MRRSTWITSAETQIQLQHQPGEGPGGGDEAGRHPRKGAVQRTTSIGACLAIAALLTAAGCTSSKSDGPTHTPNPTTPGSSTSGTPSTASSTPTSVDTAAREAQDRAAVEAAWAHYWTVYETFQTKVPQAKWDSTIAGIAVDPIRAQVLKSARADLIIDVVTFGQVVNHPYWTTPVAGKTTAVMGDCMDQSHYGSMFAKTKKKRTVGVAHDNTRATLVRGTDGTWRVKQIEYLLDVKCG